MRVNVIDPGKVRTGMRRAAYPSEAPESLPTPESLTAPYLALARAGEPWGHGRAIRGAGAGKPRSAPSG